MEEEKRHKSDGKKFSLFIYKKLRKNSAWKTCEKLKIMLNDAIHFPVALKKCDSWT